MSKFSKPTTHHFGEINPHLERINFKVYNELDNMTAKAPVYKELPVNPFAPSSCHHHHHAHHQPTASEVAEEPAEVHQCEEHHDVEEEIQSELPQVYKQNEDGDVAIIENPQLKVPEEPKTNISRFLKRQSTVRW